MSACCGTCIYWSKDETIGENVGMCRRYPPVPIAVMLSADKTTVQTHFAPTMGFGWCGEFVEKPISPAN